MEGEEFRAYFTSKEVMSLLDINKSELQTVLRPVRSQGKLLPPIFIPESSLNKIVGNRIVFTQKDIVKLSRYFKALKEFKAAREALRKDKTGSL